MNTVKFRVLIILLILIGSKSSIASVFLLDKDIYSKKDTIPSNQTDTLGTVISSIEFNIKGTVEDLKIFDNGIVPWVNLEHPEKQIDSLIDADEIVLPYQNATLIIDYPLTQKAISNISATSKGFSRKLLIQLISDKYHEIYEEEEKSATSKKVPLDERKDLINRNTTNGKYGIWGHDLSDLDLSSIEVYKKSDGGIYLILIIES
jgi:hypothetical protein